MLLCVLLVLMLLYTRDYEVSFSPLSNVGFLFFIL